MSKPRSRASRIHMQWETAWAVLARYLSGQRLHPAEKFWRSPLSFRCIRASHPLNVDGRHTARKLLVGQEKPPVQVPQVRHYLSALGARIAATTFMRTKLSLRTMDLLPSCLPPAAFTTSLRP